MPKRIGFITFLGAIPFFALYMYFDTAVNKWLNVPEGIPGPLGFLGIWITIAFISWIVWLVGIQFGWWKRKRDKNETIS